MKVSHWDFTDANKMVMESSLERIRKAAEVIADETRRRCPVGTTNRPIAKKGQHAGQPWTARDAGRLKDSIRVTEKEQKWGFALTTFGMTHGMVRVYVGHYLAWYAWIVEYYKPFLRPALDSTRDRVRDILENG